MVLSTFWSSKFSTPRSSQHWFFIVVFGHAPSHRQVPERFVTFFMPEVEDRGALAARGQL